MTAPSLRSIAQAHILAAFDAAILHQILSPYRTFLTSLGYTLPKHRDAPIVANALAEAFQRGHAGFPLDLAEALHAIVEIGVDAQWPTILQTAHDAGIDLNRLAQPHVTPRDLAARLWLCNPNLVRRLQAETILPRVRTFATWRCTTTDHRAINQPEAEQALASWAADLDTILAEHHLVQGTRIWMRAIGNHVFWIISHGAGVRRAAVNQGHGRINCLFFQPAAIDVIRYDPLRGELGIHVEQPSRWLVDALRTSCSRWIFHDPRCFCQACDDDRHSHDTSGPADFLTITMRSIDLDVQRDDAHFSGSCRIGCDTVRIERHRSVAVDMRVMTAHGPSGSD